MAGGRAACALALSVAASLLVVPSHSTAGSAASPLAASLASAHQPAGAPAADLAEDAGLTLTRVTPVVPGPGEPVTVSGVLDVGALGLTLPEQPVDAAPSPSPTGSPMSGEPAQEPIATVEVRVGSSPVDEHEDVDAWLGSTGPSQGRVVGVADVLAPADSEMDTIPFSVTVGDLGERMRGAYGVLPVSVELWPPGVAEPTAVVRTFVGYQVRKEYEPLRLTWVVPVTVPADPVLVGELGPERTAAWEALVGEQGGLRERLAAAADPALAWALDPALLDAGPAPEETPESADEPSPTAEPTTTATTSLPLSPTSPAGPTDAPDPEEPEEEPGEDDPAVRERALREEFAEIVLGAVRGREVLLLPAHDADVAALPEPAAQGDGAAAVRSLVASGLEVDDALARLADAGAEVTPAAWPAEGGWSSTHDTALHDVAGDPAEPWSVLASTSSLTTDVDGPFPAASGSVVLPYDALLTDRANEAQAPEDVVTTALAVMADSLVLLAERPGTTRHVVIALERDGASADLSDGLASVLADVPWIAPAGVGEPVHDGTLLGQAPEPAEPSLLSDDRALGLAATAARLPVAASVRVDGEADLATRGADTLEQLTSLRWRAHAQDWSTAYDPIAEDVAETFTGLSIPSRDISFLADSGLLRVTVENSLDTGIENATLDLAVEHPILRVESGPQPVEVGADSRSTVSFQATAIASGRVSVTATLRAPDGTVLGEPTSFDVRVSPTSDWIYWVLGALAVIVIVIGVGRTLMRRRPGPGPDDA